MARALEVVNVEQLAQALEVVNVEQIAIVFISNLSFSISLTLRLLLFYQKERYKLKMHEQRIGSIEKLVWRIGPRRRSGPFSECPLSLAQCFPTYLGVRKIQKIWDD